MAMGSFAQIDTDRLLDTKSTHQPESGYRIRERIILA